MIAGGRRSKSHLGRTHSSVSASRCSPACIHVVKLIVFGLLCLSRSSLPLVSWCTDCARASNVCPKCLLNREILVAEAASLTQEAITEMFQQVGMKERVRRRLWRLWENEKVTDAELKEMIFNYNPDAKDEPEEGDDEEKAGGGAAAAATLSRPELTPAQIAARGPPPKPKAAPKPSAAAAAASSPPAASSAAGAEDDDDDDDEDFEDDGEFEDDEDEEDEEAAAAAAELARQQAAKRGPAPKPKAAAPKPAAAPAETGLESSVEKASINPAS